LAEEFAALNVPFARRGARLEEWIAIARACWTGEPEARESDHYALPPDVLCLPRPAGTIPFLVGGHSPPALRRAGRVGDGWLGQQAAGALDPDALAREIATIADAAEGAPRRIVLRIVESLGRPELVAQHLPALAAAGVDEVIVDVPVQEDAAARDLDVLRAGAAA